MKKLTPEEELQFLKEIHGQAWVTAILDGLRDSFTVLQTRAQMLLGLVTICLTITGFSGPKVAESGALPRFFVFLGVVSVLVSALVVLCGPLHIRWMTQYRAEQMDTTLVHLIRRRNRRTCLYHLAVAWLLVGLTGYVLSFAAFLLKP